MTDLEEWITFLKDTGREGKEEKIKKIAEKKEEINMAWEIINELSADEYERQLYLAREKALLDEQSKIKYQEYLMRKSKEELEKAKEKLEKAKEEAEKSKEEAEKSKEEAEKSKEEAAKVKYTIVKRLLMKGQDIDTIVDITDLSRGQIEEIIEEMK